MSTDIKEKTFVLYCGIPISIAEPRDTAKSIDSINILHDYIQDENDVRKYRENKKNDRILIRHDVNKTIILFCNIQKNNIFFALYDKENQCFTIATKELLEIITQNNFLSIISNRAAVFCKMSLQNVKDDSFYKMKGIDKYIEIIDKYIKSAKESGAYVERTADMKFIRKKDDYIVSNYDLHEEINKDKNHEIKASNGDTINEDGGVPPPGE